MKTRQLLLSLLAFLLPLTSFADVWQDPETKVNYTYTIGQSTASVTAGGTEAGSPDATGDIAILPKFTIDGNEYAVTSIGINAFYKSSGLTSVTIPDSVTSIGMHAFWDCSGLTSVTIPNSVTSIGEGAFSGCSSLTSVTIPNGVTSIRERTFYGCSGLTSVTIPNSVTGIGVCTFYGCSGLTSVTIPNSVTSIGSSAFRGCSSLTSVTIGNSVTGIGDFTFYDCSGLTSVTIPGSVTSIGDFTFCYCSGLTSITIPNSVTSIGSSAFLSCSGLTSVTIPGSVTDIGERTFSDCSGLTSVTIQNGVRSIGSWAFNRCWGLTSVTIPNSVTSIGDNAFYMCSGLTSITIPNSVTSIGSSAFLGCYLLYSSFINKSTLADYNNWGATLVDKETEDGLLIKDNTIVYCRRWATSVTIPNSVSSINYWAFSDCSGLESINVETGNQIYDSRNNCNAVIKTETNELISGCKNTTIPNSVTSIGDRAFYMCRGLTSITIPNSVTSIGDGAFQYCSGLTSVTIPNSVTSIGSSAFDGTGWYNDQPDGILYLDNWLIGFKGNKPTGKFVLADGTRWLADASFSNCSGLTSVTIPNSVTSIGNYAFSNCSGLTSVTIPNSVTSIGNYAFSNCSGLTSVTIGNSVTRIGGFAFRYCSGLTSVTIPNSVTRIEGETFRGCSGLTSVTIPGSVTSIGDAAFYNCSGLTSVTIPNSVTSIGGSTFGGCSGLTSVTIPNSVTSIGMYAFGDCSGLTSVTIPGSVTSIRERTFYNCSGLTSVTIPNGVTSIGYKAFYNCSSLTSVTSLIVEPFNIGYVFSSSTYDTATLYVLPETIDAYKDTNGWKNFKNIKEMAGSTLSLTVTDESGTDITGKVSITWYDAVGNQIGTGKSLNGIEDGTELYYSIELDEELGCVYREVKMRKVVVEGETVTCQLEEIGRVTLEGRVSATDIDKNTMAVNVKQMLNGKYPQTYTTQTDEQGVFRVEVYDDETDITISGDGYLDATLHRDGFSVNGNVGTIPVSLISGFAIAANITMKAAAAEGEAETIAAWTDGLTNIDFTLTNTTKGAAITDFTVQNGSVIIRTGAAVGDGIALTAKSKQGIFADATTTFTIKEGANSFDLQLTELGGVDATCTASSNGSTVGYIYDGSGLLAARGSYVGETLSLRHLKSGAYTLVSMGNSMLLGSMTRLADLTATGLKEGTDYVTSSVTVTDGELAEVNVSEVPRLDESQFYYTSNDTYFSANKPSVTAGNYLTLQAHVDFKPEYANKVDAVTLTIDLPEGCEMVENSVIANRAAVPHTVSGNRVTMTLNQEQYGSQLRFCIIPTLNQNYTVTAMAQFDIDGQVTQPIGTAQFEAKGLSLSVVEQTSDTNITINGTAKGHSEVSIYDNDVLIGKTESKADGLWTAQCELYKPYSHSFHEIYAKIVTDGGMELTSETRQVEYDKNNLVPEKVTMLYYNPEYVGQYNIVFDLINGTTTPSSYYFFPYKNWPDWYVTRETEPKDFTFLADFSRNDTTSIKNVNIKVLNSDGTVRTLPTVFDEKQGKWVATTKYSSSSRLPKNVAVEYDINPSALDSKERMEEENRQIEAAIEQYILHVSKSGHRIIMESDEELIVAYEQAANDSIYLGIKLIPHSIVESFEEIAYHYVNEQNDIWFFDTQEGATDLIYVWDNEYACQISVSEVNFTMPLLSGKRRAMWNNWGDLGRGIVRGINSLPIIGNNDLLKEIDDYNYWQDQYFHYIENHMKIDERTMSLLMEKCDDGEYKLSKYDMERFFKYKSRCSDDCISFENNMRDMLDRYAKSIIQRCWISAGLQAASLVGGKALGKFTKVGAVLDYLINSNAGIQIGNYVGTSLATNFVSETIGVFATDSWIGLYLSKYCEEQEMKLINEYASLNRNIKNSYRQCPKDDDEENNDESTDNKDDFEGNGTTPQIDPSGYVYEAVLSNRLEGVTATCYQKVMGEDMYGDPTEEAVVWNAADYSQQNPQLTDATGFYRWDVPQGMWQVKYEKEGYETAYSEWLPVPPPQLDVNIGMKQSTPPTVTQMRGYESGITIDMSKYMLPATMDTKNITAVYKGTTVQGSIAMLNAEQAPLSGETYVQRVKFVPQSRFHVGDEVTVTVGKDVKSYCGVSMTASHTETVKIASEIDTIAVAGEVSVPYRSAYDIYVQVLPETAAAGKTLRVSTSSEMIASLRDKEVAIGESGWAVVRVNGDLPGGAVLTFSIDGYDITATTKVRVKSYQKGDVNHDNLIDVADIAQIIDLMAGCECISSDEADVNGDGVVDVADIATVISIMAKE